MKVLQCTLLCLVLAASSFFVAGPASRSREPQGAGTRRRTPIANQRWPCGNLEQMTPVASR